MSIPNFFLSNEGLMMSDSHFTKLLSQITYYQELILELMADGDDKELKMARQELLILLKEINLSLSDTEELLKGNYIH